MSAGRLPEIKKADHRLERESTETGWLISVLHANTNASNKAESSLETERQRDRRKKEK